MSKLTGKVAAVQNGRVAVTFLGPFSRYSRGDVACFDSAVAQDMVDRNIAVWAKMQNAPFNRIRTMTRMILTLAEAKTQLRLELDFDEHDSLLTSLIGAAQRSIERSYYCRLVENRRSLTHCLTVRRVTSLMKISSWPRR